AHLAQNHLRRHHLAIGQRRVAAPAIRENSRTGAGSDHLPPSRGRYCAVAGLRRRCAMSEPMRLFVGSYPEFYDRLLVPVLFAPYARTLAARLSGMTVGSVLEIGAGTGVVPRALVHTLPEAVSITATDLNPPMLDRARSHTGMERVH